MKSGPLSDAKVIANLNQNFIPVIVDPSDPKSAGVIPGLALWEKSYASNWAYRLGYAAQVMVSSDGKMTLAASGIAKHHWRDVAHSPNHDPAELDRLLAAAFSRHERYRAIQESPDSLTARADLEKLQAEIIRSIQQLSRGNDGRTATIPARES